MMTAMKFGLGTMVVVGGLGLGAVAQDKVTMPDAQVESNVLRALASAPDLSTQNIQTTTVYGVVTLSGSVKDEAARVKAENLAARAEGVKKVVDEMSVGANAEVGPTDWRSGGEWRSGGQAGAAVGWDVCAGYDAGSGSSGAGAVADTTGSSRSRVDRRIRTLRRCRVRRSMGEQRLLRLGRTGSIRPRSGSQCIAVSLMETSKGMRLRLIRCRAGRRLDGR